MVSRSDSVQAARPSSRAIATRSERAPPKSEGAKKTSRAVAPASTTQRVNSRISRPAPMASGSRAPSRLSVGSSDDGSTGVTASTSTVRRE